MAEVAKTADVKPVSTQEPSKLDAETLSFYIGTGKINDLDKRLENYLQDVQKRLEAIRFLQNLRQKIAQSDEKLDLSQESELKVLMDRAKEEYGLEWSKKGWAKIEERDALMDALHLQITAKENENQTVFMRINRIMSDQSQASSIFAKILHEVHSTKIRVIGRINQR